MAGRLAIGVALATCFLLPASLYAQGAAPPAGPPGVAQNPYYATAPNAPVYGSPPYPAPIAPAGDYGPAPTTSQGPNPNPYIDSNGDRAKALITDSGEIDQTPLEEALDRAIRNVSVRIDYLDWTISRPHTELIGAAPAVATMNPTQLLQQNSLRTDPTKFFPISVDEFGIFATAFAREYDTAPLPLNNNQGVQGTLALPLTYGTAELSAFILGRGVSEVNPGGLTPNDSTFAAIDLKQPGRNGQVTDVLETFTNLQAQFRSQVWGTEADLVFNPIVRKDRGLVMMPLIGYRYLSIFEAFDVEGSNANVAKTTINSRSFNNIHGPQIGARFEFIINQWITLGAEPKVAFAVDQLGARVNSFSPVLGSNFDSTTQTTFAPVGQIDAYGRIFLTNQLTLYAGYHVLGTANIARPTDQIAYEAKTVNGAAVNNIHLDVQPSGFLLEGITIGAIFTF